MGRKKMMASAAPSDKPSMFAQPKPMGSIYRLTQMARLSRHQSSPSRVRSKMPTRESEVQKPRFANDSAELNQRQGGHGERLTRHNSLASSRPSRKKLRPTESESDKFLRRFTTNSNSTSDQQQSAVVATADNRKKSIVKHGSAKVGPSEQVKPESKSSDSESASRISSKALDKSQQEAEEAKASKNTKSKPLTVGSPAFGRLQGLVLDPSGSLHYKWLMLVSLSVCYNMIFTVARGVFWQLHNMGAKWWFALDYGCDLIYLLDMYVNSQTGYLEQGILVRDIQKLRRHYVSSFAFKLDIISLLPSDLLYFKLAQLGHKHLSSSSLSPSTGSSSASVSVCRENSVPCHIIVRLNRLLRFHRLAQFFNRTESGTNFPFVFRICKLLFYILLIIHWNACVYFAVSYALGFGTDHWVYQPLALIENRNSPELTSHLSSAELMRGDTLGHQYIYCFYWSTLTLTTIGEVPMPERDEEYAFVVVDFLIGLLVFATIVGNIGSMISNMNAARADFQHKMDSVKQWMKFRKVNKELEVRIIKWFDYLWANRQTLDEDAVTAILPDRLKAETAIYVHLETLKRVHLFQDCEPGLLVQLVLKLKLQVFSPGDYICRVGDVGKEMYIVKRGELHVLAEDCTTVYGKLTDGCVFGELSILNISGLKTGNRRTANVRSVGYSDLFALNKQDLWDVLEDYPDAKRMLVDRGKFILRKDGLLADSEPEADPEKPPEDRHRRCQEMACAKPEVAPKSPLAAMRSSDVVMSASGRQAKSVRRTQKLQSPETQQLEHEQGDDHDYVAMSPPTTGLGNPSGGVGGGAVMRRKSFRKSLSFASCCPCKTADSSMSMSTTRQAFVEPAFNHNRVHSRISTTTTSSRTMTTTSHHHQRRDHQHQFLHHHHQQQQQRSTWRRLSNSTPLAPDSLSHQMHHSLKHLVHNRRLNMNLTRLSSNDDLDESEWQEEGSGSLASVASQQTPSASTSQSLASKHQQELQSAHSNPLNSNSNSYLNVNSPNPKVELVLHDAVSASQRLDYFCRLAIEAQGELSHRLELLRVAGSQLSIMNYDANKSTGLEDYATSAHQRNDKDKDKDCGPVSTLNGRPSPATTRTNRDQVEIDMACAHDVESDQENSRDHDDDGGDDAKGQDQS